MEAAVRHSCFLQDEPREQGPFVRRVMQSGWHCQSQRSAFWASSGPRSGACMRRSTPSAGRSSTSSEMSSGYQVKGLRARIRPSGVTAYTSHQ